MEEKIKGIKAEELLAEMDTNILLQELNRRKQTEVPWIVENINIGIRKLKEYGLRPTNEDDYDMKLNELEIKEDEHGKIQLVTFSDECE